MAVFEYQAKSISGDLIKDRIDAVDKDTVKATLIERGYYPVYIKNYKKGLNIDLADLTKVSTKDIAIFCRQFSFVISSGIPILRAIEIAKGQCDNKKLRGILHQVFDDVQIGRSFSEAMGKHKDIPRMLVHMIEAGEASGTLDTIMVRMADFYDKEYRQRQKIKQALTYPAFICVFAVIVVTALVVGVIPKILGNLLEAGGKEVPLPTQMIMGLSKFLVNYGVFLLIGIVSLVVGIKFYVKSSKEAQEAIDRMKISMPLFGKVNRKIVTSRFARTFSTLMGSGVSIIDSIQIAANVVNNAVINKVLVSSMDSIKKGESLGDTLEKKRTFPLMLTQMIKIGEESGTLDTILEKTAEFYDGEVETATAQLTTMIEPLIIIALAAVVGFIILAVILPIFSMSDAMAG